MGESIVLMLFLVRSLVGIEATTGVADPHGRGP